MLRKKKIILVLDEHVTDRNCHFSVLSLENQGFSVEIFRLDGFFTNDPLLDLYRCASECQVSPQQLDCNFREAQDRGMTYGEKGVDIRDITFEEYCWPYVSEALLSKIGTLEDIGCVIGTNREAVNYLVIHLCKITNVSGTVFLKNSEAYKI